MSKVIAHTLVQFKRKIGRGNAMIGWNDIGRMQYLHGEYLTEAETEMMFSGSETVIRYSPIFMIRPYLIPTTLCDYWHASKINVQVKTIEHLPWSGRIIKEKTDEGSKTRSL